MTKISTDCLKAFLEEDFSQSEIGRACQMSRQAIHQRLPKIGVSYNEMLLRRNKILLIQKLANEGYTRRKISEILSLPYQTIVDRIVRHKIKIIDNRRNLKRCAEILFLRTKGYSKKEIAQELNVPFQSLSRKDQFKEIKNQKFVNGIMGYVK